MLLCQCLWFCARENTYIFILEKAKLMDGEWRKSASLLLVMSTFWGRLDMSSPTSWSCVSNVTSTCVIKMGCAVWGCLSERNPLSGVQQKNPYRLHQPCGPDSITRSIIFFVKLLLLALSDALQSRPDSSVPSFQLDLKFGVHFTCYLSHGNPF